MNGIHLLKNTQRKPVGRVTYADAIAMAGGQQAKGARVLRMRPCSLQRVWAVAAAKKPAAEVAQRTEAARPQLVRQRCWTGSERGADRTNDVAKTPVRVASAPASRPAVEVAFYRKYTEAMLRRYMRLSMEAGRVPSLLGRELFRGNVTTYRVNSFEDVVLFCIDVERCLARLNQGEQDLIRRVALQQYTQGEAAAVLGMSLRSVVTGYAAALDRVTGMFMEGRMMEALKSCQ